MDKRIEELRDTIEKLRDELNQLFIEKDYEKYVMKSRELDQYIEKYIDLEDELGLLDE